jgi:CheY-like chemotaxis protein/DNA-directed RNA polymerase specialized sigma24 family protein
MSRLRREDLIQALPYARRYARALTGSQTKGDALVASSLRDILADDQQEPLPGASSVASERLMLYRAVTRKFGAGDLGDETGDVLSLRQRQLLLLTSLEEIELEDAAAVLSIGAADAASCLAGAREHLRASAATDVLIIEDEPIIAMDLEELVANCGHRVVGVAHTEAEAIDIASRTRPGLILADINLGAGGDGTSAVAAILRSHYAPVIFVTAYPERLLTGEAVEPAFVITKPFEPLTLAIATYQAVTGGVALDRV